MHTLQKHCPPLINLRQNLPRPSLNQPRGHHLPKPLRRFLPLHPHLLIHNHTPLPIQTRHSGLHPHLPTRILRLHPNWHRTPPFQRPHQRALRNTPQRRHTVPQRRQQLRDCIVVAPDLDPERTLPNSVQERRRRNRRRDTVAEVQTEQPGRGEDQTGVVRSRVVELRKPGSTALC